MLGSCTFFWYQWRTVEKELAFAGIILRREETMLFQDDDTIPEQDDGRKD